MYFEKTEYATETDVYSKTGLYNMAAAVDNNVANAIIIAKFEALSI